MDINDLRSAITVLSLLLFVALMVWTWRPRAKRDHDAAVTSSKRRRCDHLFERALESLRI